MLQLLDRKLRWLLILALASSAFGAVSFHATTAGANQNGGAVTTNLPTVSNNDVVLFLLASATMATTNNPPWTTPSGWSTAYNVAGFAVFYKIWLTGDPTTVGSSQQNGASSWIVSQTISYSGVDTTTPLDGVNGTVCNFIHGTPGTKHCTAPSLSPSWDNDMLIGAWFSAFASGNASTLPVSLTSRFNKNDGPTIVLGDLLLATAANTGTLNTTFISNVPLGGVQILLKAASGGNAATPVYQPTLGGEAIDLGAFQDFLNIYPQDGDLLVLGIYHSGTSVTVSGYSQVYRTTELALFTKQFNSGDATTFTVSSASAQASISAFLIRNVHSTTQHATVDTSNTTTASSTTTISPPSLSLAGSNDFLIAFYTTPNSGFTWTLPGALVYAESYANNNANAAGTWQGATNPSGTLTGTSSSSGNLAAGAVAFALAAGGNCAACNLSLLDVGQNIFAGMN